MSQTIYIWIIEQAKRHGFSFCLLIVAVYYLNKKVDDWSAKYDMAIETQIKYLKEDHNKMIIVIENNTTTIKNNTSMMEEILEKMEKK